MLYVIIKTLEERFLKKKPAKPSEPPSPDGNEDGNQDGQSRVMPTPVGDAARTTNAHQDSSVIVRQNDDNRRNDSSN